jgi:eukaryotic-like serine/threonine-protein kinase
MRSPRWSANSWAFTPRKAPRSTGPSSSPAEETLPTGTRIGEYTIERLIGTGGMGSVYIATQDRPRRTVALKIIRRGIATAGLIRRFEHEAEVLGRLHHPGIAHIHEAGAASLAPGEYPQPYIAMEYIDGPPLNAFARTRGLTTDQKLELLARVCDAVHHAHQRGVIHRDLKPGNILVDEHGQPKILDFGVARAADVDLRVVTLQTTVGQLIGTLPYMSPEQVLADPSEVDTRSDVYALGVILYELLAGRLPLDVGSRPIPEAARLIREEAPSRLGALSRSFRGDIETIVAKAMDKDKTRRYQSAQDMATDLRLHLRGLPIVAKQDSAWYVLAKQLRRHRLASAIAAAFLLTLMSFTVYASVQAGRFQRLATSEGAAKTKAQAAEELATTEARRASEQSLRLQDQLYASTVEQGRFAGLAGNLVQAEDLLWRAYLARPSSPRGRWALWEFYEKNPCLWTRSAHDAVITAIGVAPDGRIAAAGQDGGIAIFEPQQGDLIRRWSNPGRVFVLMRFSADGKSLIALSRGGRCSWFDLDSPADAGPPIIAGTSTQDPSITASALSHDAERIAFARRDGPITIESTREDATLATIPCPAGDPIFALALDRQNKRLGVGAFSGEVRLVDAQSGQTLHAWPRGSRRISMGLVFTPDGSLLISGDRSRTIDIFDTTSGQTQRTLRSELSSTRWLEVSPDGSQLISSDSGATCVWDLASGELLRQFTLHRSGHTDAAWLPSGQALVTGGRDGKLRLWEPNSVPGTRTFLEHTSWVFSAAESPDGGTIATMGGEGLICFWTPQGRLLRKVQSSSARVRAGTYSPDGARLLVGGADGMVRVLDAQSGAEITTIMPPFRSEVTVLAWTPDQSRLVVGGYHHVIGFFDAATYKPAGTLSLPRSGGIVRSLCMTADGSTLYTDGNAHEVCVFDLPSMSLRGTIPAPDVIRSVALSESASLIAAGTDDGRIVLFDAASHAPRATLDGHTTGVYALAFTPTGKVLASGSDDGTVKLWDPLNATPLVTLSPHRGEVPWVGFSRDGHSLWAGLQDRAFMTWDILHYNLNIAGNLEHQIERLRDELDPAVDLAQARSWAEQMLRQVPRLRPTAP